MRLALALFLCVSPAVAGDWAQDTLSAMTLEEKIGQLFMLQVNSQWPSDELAASREIIRRYRPGAVILKHFRQPRPRLGPRGHVDFVNELQSQSRVPLLVALDAEWGLSQRLLGTVRFPRNMALGAIQDDGLIRRMGAEVGRELKRIGVHMDLAPVVDVNVNPANPIINDRSFGEDPSRVADKGAAFMEGLQSAGVLACAKHFPGHGDTDVDSHQGLPRIAHPRERIDKVELFPFRRLIEKGVGAVMLGHLAVPALDPVLPSSLSSGVVTGLLKDTLGFRGLVVTDALPMQALRAHYQDVELSAGLAGVDLLLTGDIDDHTSPFLRKNLPEAFEGFKKAVADGRLPPAELDRRVLKILRAKQQAGLDKGWRIETAGLESGLNSPPALELKSLLYRKAVTLVRNQDGLLPLRPGGKLAYVQVGEVPWLAWLLGRARSAPFSKALAESGLPFKTFYLRPSATPAQAAALSAKLSAYDRVVVAVLGMERSPAKRFGISESSAAFLQETKNAAVVVFGNAYSAKYLGRPGALLIAYEDDPEAQKAAAAVVIGAASPEGKLPVAASPDFPAGTGLTF